MEFALLLPLLLLLVFGAAVFGQLFFSEAVLVEAAREGARTAALGGSAQAATQAAQQVAAAGGLQAAGVDVQVTGTQDGSGLWVVGTPVTVAVRYPAPVVVPLFWPILGQAYPLAASATMLVEQP